MAFLRSRDVRLAAAGWGALRFALGVAALAAPPRVIRPWTGRDGADTVTARVLGRALGARDVALGAGTLAAAARGRGVPGWAAASALADLGDTLTTVGEWRELPRSGRVLVGALAGGSAVAGAAIAAAAACRCDPPREGA